MNTLLLKYAVEVERAGSITQAADNLYMGQPNLSKAIKELEDILKFSIFKRTSKGVVPTQRGKIFLKYAKNILSQVDAMERLSDNENPDKQVFSITIPRSSYIAKAVTDFILLFDLNKDLKINVKETDSMTSINDVIEGRFSFGIIHYDLDYENYFIDYLVSKDIMYNTIWEFENLVILSKNHPLAFDDEIKSDDLVNYIEIMYGDASIPYIEDSINAEKSSYTSKTIKVYDRSSEFNLLSKLHTSYVLGSPIPNELLKRYNLVQRHCISSKKYKDVLIYTKGYSFSSMDKKFMDKLYESKNEVSLKNYI